MLGRPGLHDSLCRLLLKRDITLKSAPGTAFDGSITGPPLKRSVWLPVFIPVKAANAFVLATSSMASPPHSPLRCLNGAMASIFFSGSAPAISRNAPAQEPMYEPPRAMKARSSRCPLSPSSAASTLLFPPGITRMSARSSAPLRIASPSTKLASTPSAWSISCIHLNAPTPRAPGPTYTAARTGAPLVIAAHASSEPPIGRGGGLSQSTQPLNASIAADAIPTNVRRVRASAKAQPLALFSSFVLIFVLVMFRARGDHATHVQMRR